MSATFHSLTNKHTCIVTRMKKGGILTRSFCKFRNVATSLQKYRILDYIADWSLFSFMCKEDEPIPKDVPRGHVAVYVGQELKRFVIKISLLNHPLFQALLECAEEVFEFATGSRLCIPCSETMFLAILKRATSKQDQRWSLCFQGFCVQLWKCKEKKKKLAL